MLAGRIPQAGQLPIALRSVFAMTESSEFFDSEQKIELYRSRRYRAESPNETLERPIFLDLLGDVRGKRVLDLGCGDGLFGFDLLSAGCQSYVGIENSPQMVAVAREVLDQTQGRVIQTGIEDWDYPAAHYDLVISRLALHYVADLPAVFGKVKATLVPGGRFIFSTVHPVITSCDRSRAGGGAREDWIVDDYFATGPRQVFFMGDYVEQYHRTVEDIFTSLQNAGFAIEHLRESRPRPEQFTDRAMYERRRRIPLFLFLSGKKV
jgi:SAM-dependent methyltransferase